MELFAFVCLFVCLFSKMKIQVVPTLYELKEDILTIAGNH